MPTYRITAPNGKTYQIEGPEGATQEEVIAAVLEQHPEAAGGGNGGQSHTGGLTPKASHGGDNPDHIVESKMAFIAKALGVDIDAPLTPQQLEAFRKAYIKTEGASGNNVGNLKNPGGQGFQEFTTPEAGEAAIAAQIVRDYNRGQTTIRSLIEGYPIDSPPTPPKVKAEGPEAPEDAPAPVSDPGPTPPEADLTVKMPAEPDDGFFRMPKDMAELGRGIAQGTGDIVEGLADIPGIVVNPIATLINKALGYDNATADFGKDVRKLLGLPDSQNPISSEIIKGATGGLTGAGAARSLAKLASNPSVAAALADMGSTPIRDTVGGATAALGAEAGRSGAEAVGLGETGQTIAGVAGGILGGTAGYSVGTAAHNAKPGVRDARWVDREVERNPFAAFDAEIVKDLEKARNATARSPGDPKGRAELTAKTINSVENSYHVELKNAINALDIDPQQKLQLWESLGSKYSLPQEEVNALRGTVPGNAVADAITKVQRLRHLTPELSRTGKAANVVDKIGYVAELTGIGAKAGAPGALAISGAMARQALRKMGSGEAARVNAADALLKKAGRYDKLGQRVGPSGAVESRQALREAVGEASMADEAAAAIKQEERLANQAEKADVKAYTKDRRANVNAAMDADPELQRRAARLKAVSDFTKAQDKSLEKFDPEAPMPDVSAPTKADIASFRKSITDPAPDMRDAANLVPTDTKLASRLQARNSAITKLEAAQSDWEARLADPSTAPKAKAPKAPPKPKAPNPVDVAIDDAIAKGIRGDSGVRNAFATRLGIDEKDLDPVLDAVEKQLPDFAGEINRIRNNYPTANRKLGSIIGGRMQKAAEELGVPKKVADAPAPKPSAATPKPSPAKPATVPVDEAAQARLAEADPFDPRTWDSPAAPAKVPPPPQDLPIDFEAAKKADAEAGFVMNQDGSFTNTRTGETQAAGLTGSVSDETGPYVKQVRREKQWADAKNRNVTDGMTILSDMMSRLSPQAQEALGVMGEHAVKRLKTGDEARAFAKDVEEQLRASGASPDEIATVNKGLYDIAMIKPYQTQDQLQAGLYTRGRGRPKKPTN